MQNNFYDSNEKEREKSKRKEEGYLAFIMAKEKAGGKIKEKKKKK